MAAHETGGSRLLVTSCVGCRARLLPLPRRGCWPLRTETIIIHYIHERRHIDAHTSSLYPHACFGIAARPGPHFGRVRQFNNDRRLNFVVGFTPERFYWAGL